jgi:DNA-binding transcriptional MocR family regulator
MSWSPDLADSAAPAYRRLADALAADVRGGRLGPGVRLPPHRDLAHRLGVSVATVTRAYAEAEAAGLITSQVGRGSFVAATAAAPVSIGPIDLARNLPPPGPAERRIAQAFSAVARRPDLADHLGYPLPGGSPLLRQALVEWLAQTANFPGLEASRMLLTAGSQQAVAAALGAVMRPGEAFIAEEASFAGIKTLAAQMDYRLLPGAMDAEGLTPDALERGAAQGAKAAYVLPVQNPTARVLGDRRRRDLVGLARRRGIWLVEDDLYGAYARDLGLAPLAALAPERVLYVGGLSKILAPGLRLGFVATPPGAIHERALEALRAIAFTAPGLSALVALQWLSDGTASAILAEVLDEAKARTLRARQLLGRHVSPSPLTASPHLWLPMADELAAERVAGRALRRGVALTPPRAPVLDGAPVRGLRVCLGGPRDAAELERGLLAVAWALEDEPEGRDAV